VYEAIARPFHRVGAKRRLLVEQLDNGDFKYYVSNLPSSVPATEILRKAHARWKVEQGYQQLKEELGLDHFEGRSWAGLHHHIALCVMAYSFLQLLRLESKKKP
jgi:SRSO17 transposase